MKKSAAKSAKTAKSPSSSSKTATKTATSTKTSTDAYTQGNITVTGGAGRGANTKVNIVEPKSSPGKAKKAKGKS